RTGRRRPVVRARFERDVQRRPTRAIARYGQRHHLGVRRPTSRVPALADDLAVALEHGANERMRPLDLPPPPLGELERPLEAQARSWTSRRYARGRSSRPKIAVAATNSVAPASYTSRMFCGPMPPSTWTCIDFGTSERSSRSRSSDSGMNACPE